MFSYELRTCACLSFFFWGGESAIPRPIYIGDCFDAIFVALSDETSVAPELTIKNKIVYKQAFRFCKLAPASAYVLFCSSISI